MILHIWGLSGTFLQFFGLNLNFACFSTVLPALVYVLKKHFHYNFVFYANLC